MSFHISSNVIVAAVLIVISLAMLFRWHIVSSSIGVHWLDRWIGKREFARSPTEGFSADSADQKDARRTQTRWARRY